MHGIGEAVHFRTPRDVLVFIDAVFYAEGMTAVVAHEAVLAVMVDGEIEPREVKAEGYKI